MDLNKADFAVFQKLAKKPDENAGDGLNKMLSSADAHTSPMMQQLADVLARKRQEEQTRLTEEAAELIVGVINSSDIAIENLRAQNAEARRSAEAAVNKIEKIAVARVYGERTMNWLPLLQLLGEKNSVVGVFPKLEEVPEEDAKKILAEIKGARAAAKKAAAK